MRCCQGDVESELHHPTLGGWRALRGERFDPFRRRWRGATVELIGPKAGDVKLGRRGGKTKVDHAIAGAPSVPFDAVALLPSATGAEELAQRAAVKDFVSDASAHHKFIGVGRPPMFCSRAGVGPDEGVVTISDAGNADASSTSAARSRFWERDVRP